MSKKKPGTNEKLLEKYLQVILGNNLSEMNNYFFNIETLKKRGSVTRYLNEGMPEEIRKYLSVFNKPKISKNYNV